MRNINGGDVDAELFVLTSRERLGSGGPIFGGREGVFAAGALFLPRSEPSAIQRANYSRRMPSPAIRSRDAARDQLSRHLPRRHAGASQLR